jgi:hypothetical protein
MKSLLLLLLLGCIQPLVAQIGLSIELERTNFVAHEAVNAVITLRNQAGKDIALGGPAGQSWLQFNVQKADGGQVVATEGDPKVEPTMLKEGASLTRKINLARFYPLDEPGAYLVNCSMYFADLQKWLGSSNKALVRINSSRAPFYERTVGVPKSHAQAGRYRRYRLFTSKSSMKVATGQQQEVNLLYVSITDEETEENIATYPLGPILTYRDPQPITDRAGNLCVLYMATPQLYQYVTMDVDGAVKEQQTYKTGGASPELMQTNTGEVRVRGGVIFDAINEEAKAKEEKSKIRGLNERPQ